jgi:hypothetical protein
MFIFNAAYEIRGEILFMVFMRYMEKYFRPGEATDDNMAQTTYTSKIHKQKTQIIYTNNMHKQNAQTIYTNNIHK